MNNWRLTERNKQSVKLQVAETKMWKPSFNKISQDRAQDTKKIKILIKYTTGRKIKCKHLKEHR
jgi:hypothetical protein